MRRYRYKLSAMLEDDANVNQQNDAQQAAIDAKNKQIDSLKTQYMQVQAQIQQKTKQYQTDIANLKNKMLLIGTQIAKLGGEVMDTKQAASEAVNVSYRLSKKLFESLQSSKTDELADVIQATFDKLIHLSYHMDPKASMTFARRLVSWINEQNWNDGENHSEELGERVRSYLSGNSVSMSRKEINDFNDEFLNILKDNSVFNWIFGRRRNRF